MSSRSWNPWLITPNSEPETPPSTTLALSLFDHINDLDITKREQIPESSYNFISILALTKNLNFDFLPITWLPAIETLGVGGTAEIRQDLVNMQMSFAFKRTTLNRDNAFRALFSEISVLGHPAVRTHENIIKLAGICWDVSPGDSTVWPVLVFQKSTCGDLRQFMHSEAGRALPVTDALSLLTDVANGIACLHMSGQCRLLSIVITRADLKLYKVLSMATSNQKIF
jgi:Protein tyrosine and serine/threonine kinase